MNELWQTLLAGTGIAGALLGGFKLTAVWIKQLVDSRLADMEKHIRELQKALENCHTERSEMHKELRDMTEKYGFLSGKMEVLQGMKIVQDLQKETI